MAREVNRPVAKFGPYRAGNGVTIEAAVWRNMIERDGKEVPVFNISIGRSWYDQQKEKFRNSEPFSLRPGELQALKYALDQAYDYVMKDHQEE